MKFRKKPVVIEAVQWRGNNLGEVLDFMKPITPMVDDSKVQIPTLEGIMQAALDDWIIRGVKGELYPCKPDIFEATYETAEVTSATFG